MTPQLAPQLTIVTRTQPGNAHLAEDTHLTEEQFGELLAPLAPTANSGGSLADLHLLSCAQCSAELAALRQSLALFRDASTAYADSELRHQPQLSLPARPLAFPLMQPAYWVAAAALFLAALLPMQTLHQRSLHSAAPAYAATVTENPVESDEALLEDVNREVSASVPASMQALADPTEEISSAIPDTSIQTSLQRKD